MSTIDDSQPDGKHVNGEGDAESAGPGNGKNDDLKKLAAAALADVEELKRSEKAASAYASSAFSRQWKEP